MLSSGLLPWLINKKTFVQDTFGAPDTNELALRRKHLLGIEANAKEKLDIKSMIDIPLIVGNLTGICIATSNPIHFDYLYTLLKDHNKRSHPRLLNYYNNNKSFLEGAFRLHS